MLMMLLQARGALYSIGALDIAVIYLNKSPPSAEEHISVRDCDEFLLIFEIRDAGNAGICAACAAYAVRGQMATQLRFKF